MSFSLRQICIAVLINSFSFFLIASTAVAVMITIEPDDFSVGTDLSNVSPYVSLSTTGGAVVYASPLVGEGQTAPGIVNTGPFQNQVFSEDPEINSEWWSWPSYANVITDPYNTTEWAKDAKGLQITFNVSVNYVSLFGLELFGDAGWGDDPILWSVYDSGGDLVFSGYKDSYPATGSIGSFYDGDYNYWYIDFSYPDIATVIVGGESEPTTLDRLAFNVSPVPEPATIILLASGLLGLFGASRKKLKKR